MGDDSDITEEVRDRLEGDDEVDTDSDSSSDPLFTVDGDGDAEEDQ